MTLAFVRQHRAKRTTAQQMHMDMVHFLAAVAVAVDDQPIAIVGKTFIAGDLRRDGHHPAQRQLMFSGDVIYGRNQNIRDNQNMGGRLRGDVAKSGHKLILIDNIRRDLPANDFAENRFFCHD